MVRPKKLIKVLCWFDYFCKSAGLTQTHKGSVMIEVETSDHIPWAFKQAMGAKLVNWYDRNWTARPFHWTMTSYLPEHGKPVF